MKVAVAFLVLVAVVCVQSADLEKEWSDFKTKFERNYATPAEETYRKGIFAESLKKVEEHNKKFKAGESTFELGINQFSDKTSEEFSKGSLGLLPLGDTAKTTS